VRVGGCREEKVGRVVGRRGGGGAVCVTVYTLVYKMNFSNKLQFVSAMLCCSMLYCAMLCCIMLCCAMLCYAMRVSIS
jgi:hypothetical protein